MQRYINLISYFGGKYPQLKWLLSKFPSGKYHFIDIMCGSANVALNVNYPLVTINDVNEEVVNLFRVLRNDYDEFLRILYFTPFSRAEHERIVTDNINGLQFDDVERARRFFVRSQIGFGANGSQNNHYGCGFEWVIHKTNYYRVDNWNVKLKRLAKITARLRNFQIENKDAMLLFDQVNKPGNIVYFDPPYIMGVRKSKKRYKHEVEHSFHYQIAEKMRTAECLVAVSGYDSELYDEIFSDFYKTVNIPQSANTGKVLKVDALWTNYNTETVSGSYKMKFEH